MKPDEFKLQMSLLLNLARLVKDLKLSEMLYAIDRADTLGPILDPSLWMRSNKSRIAWRNLIEAALMFQTTVERIEANVNQ